MAFEHSERKVNKCANYTERKFSKYVIFVQSLKVISNSWQPHGLQYTRFLCPSLFPGVCSNSCSLNWWCHSTISSSLSPFSACSQSFPALRYFPMSWFFASSGQSIGASGSVLLMNFQRWFPLGLTGLISLVVQGTFKSLLQHHSLKASILCHSALLMVQL